MSDCLFEASSHVCVCLRLQSCSVAVCLSALPPTGHKFHLQLSSGFFLFWGQRSETNRFHSRGQTVTGPSQQELTAERRRRNKSVETVKGREMKTPAGTNTRPLTVNVCAGRTHWWNPHSCCRTERSAGLDRPDGCLHTVDSVLIQLTSSSSSSSSVQL